MIGPRTLAPIVVLAHVPFDRRRGVFGEGGIQMKKKLSLFGRAI